MYVPQDARNIQIGALSLFLGVGVLLFSFQVPALCIVSALGGALGTQLLFSKLFHIGRVEWKSALITSLSLCLLLRVMHPSLMVLAAVFSIGSKFVLRVRGKHIFNPANFGLVIVTALFGSAWLSPGQWGSGAFLAVLFLLLGISVITRTARREATLWFLFTYGGLILIRALRLGDPMTIPLHQLSTGSLLLFSFFMISDPRTLPDSPSGRVTAGILVGVFSYIIRFWWYSPLAPLYALFLLSPFFPFIDLLGKGVRFEWRSSSTTPREVFT